MFDFYKVEQIFLLQSSFQVSGRMISAIIRILFRYTDNPPELCGRNITNDLMKTTGVKEKMVGQVYADLLCDFMFRRLFILAEIGNFTPTEYE